MNITIPLVTNMRIPRHHRAHFQLRRGNSLRPGTVMSLLAGALESLVGGQPVPLSLKPKVPPALLYGNGSAMLPVPDGGQPVTVEVQGVAAVGPCDDLALEAIVKGTIGLAPLIFSWTATPTVAVLSEFLEAASGQKITVPRTLVRNGNTTFRVVVSSSFFPTPLPSHEAEHVATKGDVPLPQVMILGPRTRVIRRMDQLEVQVKADRPIECNEAKAVGDVNASGVETTTITWTQIEGDVIENATELLKGQDPRSLFLPAFTLTSNKTYRFRVTAVTAVPGDGGKVPTATLKSSAAELVVEVKPSSLVALLEGGESKAVWGRPTDSEPQRRRMADPQAGNKLAVDGLNSSATDAAWVVIDGSGSHDPDSRIKVGGGPTKSADTGLHYTWMCEVVTPAPGAPPVVSSSGEYFDAVGRGKECVDATGKSLAPFLASTHTSRLALPSLAAGRTMQVMYFHNRAHSYTALHCLSSMMSLD